MRTMQTPPKVTLGMPVFNGEKFLRDALESLLKQNYKNFELVISDNASTDLTESICLEYARQDPRIRYERTPTNKGYHYNFNRVLELARGDYFVWTAHDDLWDPDFLGSLVELLEENPTASIAFPGMALVTEDAVPFHFYPLLSQVEGRDLFNGLVRFVNHDEQLGKVNIIYGLMRTHRLRSAGGFRRWGKRAWGEDLLICFRTLCFGPVVFHPDILWYKRHVPTSLGNTVAPRGKKLNERLRGIGLDFVDLISYHIDYFHLIRIAPNLTVTKRLQLAMVVLLKLLRTMASKSWTLIRAGLRRLLIQIHIFSRSGKFVRKVCRRPSDES